MEEDYHKLEPAIFRCAEQSEKIVSDSYHTYIINQGMEALHISEIKVEEFIKFCLKEFRKNLEDWSEFVIFEQTKEEYKKIKEKNKKNFLRKIEEIEKILRDKTNCIPN